MHITYGIIYYFLIITIVLTFMLVLFLVRPLRMRLLRIASEGGFNLDNQLIYTALYFTFAVLIAVLIDSGWAWKQLYQYNDFEQFANNSGITIADYNQIGVIRKEMYLSLYRKYREYFIAQRNFILSCSACFVWFVFCRILIMITEIADNQKSIFLAKLKYKQENQNITKNQTNLAKNKETQTVQNIRDPLTDRSNKIEIKEQPQQKKVKIVETGIINKQQLSTAVTGMKQQ